MKRCRTPMSLVFLTVSHSIVSSRLVACSVNELLGYFFRNSSSAATLVVLRSSSHSCASDSRVSFGFGGEGGGVTGGAAGGISTNWTSLGSKEVVFPG